MRSRAVSLMVTLQQPRAGDGSRTSSDRSLHETKAAARARSSWTPPPHPAIHRRWVEPGPSPARRRSGATGAGASAGTRGPPRRSRAGGEPLLRDEQLPLGPDPHRRMGGGCCGPVGPREPTRIRSPTRGCGGRSATPSRSWCAADVSCARGGPGARTYARATSPAPRGRPRSARQGPRRGATPVPSEVRIPNIPTATHVGPRFQTRPVGAHADRGAGPHPINPRRTPKSGSHRILSSCRRADVRRYGEQCPRLGRRGSDLRVGVGWPPSRRQRQREVPTPD